MKKLREIITESFNYRTTYQDDYNMEHAAKVGSHTLNIMHMYDKEKGSLQTNFSLNGSYVKDPSYLHNVPYDKRMAIFTTVKNSTIQAISHFKPKSYEWYTPNPGKMKVYNLFAKNTLQKKFGGKISQQSYDKGKIEFDEAVNYSETKAKNVDIHTAHINGKTLHIDHWYNDGHAETSFLYNGKDVKNSFEKIPQDESMKVYHTVRNSINDFIQKRKPKSLQFFAADKRYNDAYGRIANHIAKIHNGEVEKDDDTYRINFNHGNK
jgi:hypothetical protein